ncbi:unnamed protein product [Leptosia nina]|uniref:Uncharacterized protein n=1 Tax=Leptosia nina TaxID=320188 RepID=A0AAV1JZ87_9NEOP
MHDRRDFIAIDRTERCSGRVVAPAAAMGNAVAVRQVIVIGAAILLYRHPSLSARTRTLLPVIDVRLACTGFARWGNYSVALVFSCVCKTQGSFYLSTSAVLSVYTVLVGEQWIFNSSNYKRNELCDSSGIFYGIARRKKAVTIKQERASKKRSAIDPLFLIARIFHSERKKLTQI